MRFFFAALLLSAGLRAGAQEPAGDRPRAPAQLAAAYGEDEAGKIKYAEAFEICEYGRQPNENEIRRLFPFFPSK